jgi:hypothetical protein
MNWKDQEGCGHGLMGLPEGTEVTYENMLE